MRKNGNNTALRGCWGRAERCWGKEKGGQYTDVDVFSARSIRQTIIIIVKSYEGVFCLEKSPG